MTQQWEEEFNALWMAHFTETGKFAHMSALHKIRPFIRQQREEAKREMFEEMKLNNCPLAP